MLGIFVALAAVEYTTAMTQQKPKEPDMTTRTPHPIADIICAWANGFRVEVRDKRHSGPWGHVGRYYAIWDSPSYEHRIHADDLAAWESFKRKPAEDAASDERARIVDYIRDLSRTPSASTLAYRVLADKIRDAKDIF